MQEEYANTLKEALLGDNFEYIQVLQQIAAIQGAANSLMNEVVVYISMQSKQQCHAQSPSFFAFCGDQGRGIHKNINASLLTNRLND